MKYDQSFESVVRVDASEIAQEDVLQTEHITCKDIQEALGISAYHVKLYLAKIKAFPIGKKVNRDDDGKKRRGPHVFFYDSAVLDQLRTEMEKV